MSQEAPQNNNSLSSNDNSTEVMEADRPVAYDTQGRPLYLRPEDGQTADSQSGANWSPAFNPESHGNHQFVHVSRPFAPADAEVPPEVMARCEESHRRFPQLNLSKGEFIISAIKRNSIGLLQIWSGAILIIVTFVAVAALFLVGQDQQTFSLAAVGVGLISLLVLGGALIASYVYNGNRFYLTNESVIQEIQVGLLNKHEQTVSLANIEDASYYQKGLLPYMFNYGTIRLSTEGDETTYRFHYVTNPKRHIAVLNNAVESFKNGRPVTPTDDRPS